MTATVLEFKGPGAAPAAPESALIGVADVLSPSQAGCFLDCPAKWCFKHLLNLPEPPTASLGLGNAVDDTSMWILRQKKQTGSLPEADAIKETYEQAFADAFEGVELRADEDLAEQRDLGARLIREYMDKALPGIEPAEMQLPLHGVIGGVRISARLDVLETSGRIIEVKTSGQKPSELSASHRAQLTTYAMLCPRSNGECRRDTLVKTKVAGYVPHSFTVQASDVQYVEAIYPQVQEAMRDGVFYPCRDSRMCSRKYCAFWRDCEKEYGGRVKS